MTKLIIILSLISNVLGLNINNQVVDNSLKEAIIFNPTSTPLMQNVYPEITSEPIVINKALRAGVLAKNYILMDLKSNEILAKSHEHSRVPIASTTKIMTASVALENYNLDDVVTVSQKAAAQIGSDSRLIAGEKMTVRNLLNCMLIVSGNDAAYALAEHYSGGVEGFVDLMNKKAASLNMADSHYLDPAGLSPDGYSSAYDLSIIARYALKNSVFASIVGTAETTVDNVEGTRHHDLKNSNRLVNDYDYPGAIGVKTGYIPEAGHCLVGAAKRNSTTLIAVILNTNYDDVTASALEARKLLDYGFENYRFQ